MYSNSYLLATVVITETFRCFVFISLTILNLIYNVLCGNSSEPGFRRKYIKSPNCKYLFPTICGWLHNQRLLPRCSSIVCQAGEPTTTVLCIPGHLVNPWWSVEHILKYVAITLPLFRYGFTGIYNLCWKTEVLRATVHCTINLIKCMVIIDRWQGINKYNSSGTIKLLCMMFGLCLFLLTKLSVIKLLLIGIMNLDAPLTNIILFNRISLSYF